MIHFLEFFILLPIMGLVGSILIPAKREDLLSWEAFTTVGIHLAVATFFIAYWIYQGSPTLNLKEIVLYESHDYSFYLDFYFDRTTATYLFVGAMLLQYDPVLLCGLCCGHRIREPGDFVHRLGNSRDFFFPAYCLLP